MKKSIIIGICLMLVQIMYAQKINTELYYSENSTFVSDTFNISYRQNATSDNYLLMDSAIYKLTVIESIDRFSYHQNVISKQILPFNCEATMLETYRDSYGNLKQDIKLSHFTSSNFGFDVVYKICTKTTFPKLEVCPFDSVATSKLNSTITQYLVGNANIQISDPKIIKLAQEIKGDAVTIAEIVNNLIKWSEEHLKYDYTFNYDEQDAVSVLENGVGVCSGYSNFSCAILRALGIPARYTSGVLVDMGELTSAAPVGIFSELNGTGAHSWIEVYYPSMDTWIASEPQSTANLITPTHVTERNTDPYLDRMYIYPNTITNVSKNWSRIGVTTSTIHNNNISYIGTGAYSKYDKIDWVLSLKHSILDNCNPTSNLPEVPKQIIADTIICKNSTITISVPSIPRATSYLWTLPNGVKQETTAPSISVLAENYPYKGKITVAGKNSNGLGKSLTRNIWTIDIPQQYIMTAPTDICNGQNDVVISLSEQSASAIWKSTIYNCMYSKDNYSMKLYPKANVSSGYVSVKGVNQCGEGELTTVDITFHEQTPQPIIDVDSAFMCYNSTEIPSFTITNPMGEISWNNNVGESEYTPEKPLSGEFVEIIAIQQLDGCVASNPTKSMLYVGEEVVQPFFNFSTDSTFVVETKYNDIQWYKNNQQFSTLDLLSFKPIESGEYHITVADSNNCSVASDKITFTPIQNITSNITINSNYSNVNFNGTKLNVEIQNSYEISIYSIQGALLFKQEANGLFEKDLSFLKSGVYLITVKGSSIDYNNIIRL